jgi:hypothetical protein
MRQILYTCDVCGVQKKEANHWFIIFTCYPGTRLYKWSAADPTDKQAVHLCGENCVNRKIMQLIGGTPKREEANGVCV